MRKRKVNIFTILSALMLLCCWDKLVAAQCSSLNFGAGITSTTSNFGDSVIKGDFNNDGRIDLVTIGRLATQDGISIILGQGDGSFASPQTIQGPNNGNPLNQSPLSGVAGDFNNDGNLDLLIINLHPAVYQIYLGQGNGTFTLHTQFNAPSDESDVPGAVALADLNGDGILDIVGLAQPKVSRLGGPLQTFSGNGDGTFLAGPVLEATPGANTAIPSTLLGVADLTGDGKPDLVVSTFTRDPNTTTIRVIPGLGDGTFNFSGQIVTPGQNLTTYFLFDFNQDNLPDLLFIGTSPDNTANVQLNNGDGSFGAVSTVFTGGFLDTTLLAGVADYNGDGQQDIALIIEQSNGVDFIDNRIEIFLGNGQGEFSSTPAGTLELSLNLPHVVTADFNNDQHSDFALFPSLATDIVTVILTTCAGCPTISITPPTLSNGKVGVNYKRVFKATGGTQPYSFSFTGTLPPGLSLSQSGRLTGKPTASGHFNFTIIAMDQNGCTGSRTYNLTIKAGHSKIKPKIASFK